MRPAWSLSIKPAGQVWWPNFFNSRAGQRIIFNKAVLPFHETMIAYQKNVIPIN
jgi:hypothetical protein